MTIYPQEIEEIKNKLSRLAEMQLKLKDKIKEDTRRLSSLEIDEIAENLDKWRREYGEFTRQFNPYKMPGFTSGLRMLNVTARDRVDLVIEWARENFFAVSILLKIGKCSKELSSEVAKMMELLGDMVKEISNL